MNASLKLIKDCPCMESYGLKIEWVKEKTKDDFTKDRQIIVRMNEKDRWDKNMVYAVHAYARRGFIPYARPYMSTELDTSLNMALTKRILTLCSDGSLREFYENIYSIYKKNPRIDILFNGLLRADNNGIFTRIYINEISKLTYLLKESTPNDGITTEIQKFTNYIIDIAKRQIGDLTNLLFNETYIHVGVVLPSSYVFGESEAKHGARRVAKLFEKGCKTVYILALGSKIEVANGIRELIKNNDDFICVSKSDYYRHLFNNGSAKGGICIELQSVNVNSEMEMMNKRDKSQKKESHVKKQRKQKRKYKRKF